MNKRGKPNQLTNQQKNMQTRFRLNEHTGSKRTDEQTKEPTKQRAQTNEKNLAARHLFSVLYVSINVRHSKIFSFVPLAGARLFRRRDFFFDGAKIFEKLDRGDAIDFIKKSSKSELSSRFFGRFRHGISCLQHREIRLD